MRTLTLFALTALVAAYATNSSAQRSGDSARITVGMVERAESVQLQSNTGRNSLIGGAIGWGLARNQSSAGQAAGALAGAAIGGGATARNQNRDAMQYTIRTGEGSAVQVVTDQREIRIGDCVVVEETGDHANVRRMDPTMCSAGSSPAVRSQVEAGLQDDANRCDEAKDRLFAATTPEEVEVAQQVMQILCND